MRRRSTQKGAPNQLKFSEFVKHETKIFIILKKFRKLSYGYEDPFKNSKN